MEFEVFDKRVAISPSEPVVGIQKGGVFTLNRAAFELLGKPVAVELMFNRAKKVIGFRAAPKVLPHAYSVRPNSAGSTYQVSGSAFARYYGISTEKGRRWRAELVGKILTVDTTQPSLQDRYAMRS